MDRHALALLFLAITLVIGLSGIGLFIRFRKRDLLPILIAVAGTMALFLIFALWNMIA